jgi:hypothetical protein
MTTNFVIQFEDNSSFTQQRAQKLQQSAEGGGVRHVARLVSEDHLGHEQLIIQVSVREKYASGDSVTTVASMLLDTQELSYEPAFYTDKAKCQAATNRVEGHLAYHWTSIVLTPPNIYGAVSINQRIIATWDSRLVEQVATTIAGVLRVSPRLFTASAVG